MTALGTPVRIEVWSDVVCPWCFVGKRNLERALDGFEGRDDVEVVWRSYELDPSAPTEREGRYAERLARKYGVSVGEAQAMIARIVDAGAKAGLDFRFDITRFGNTFDAHRLLHFAAEHGRQGALKERLFGATFLEGQPIGDRETLVGAAVEVGLDEQEARRVLEAGDYAEAVHDDRRRAEELDVAGVPYFVIDGRYGIGGAQPPEFFRRVFERRWAERAAEPAASASASAAPGCDGDDACAV